MSLRSWLKEFYPTEAWSAGQGTWRQAAEHSLRKWRGLLPENLAKHQVEATASRVLPSDAQEAPFELDAESCALCQRLRRTVTNGDVKNCHRCPLYQATLEECCWEGSPFSKFRTTGNPRPLIKALEAAVELTKLFARKPKAAKPKAAAAKPKAATKPKPKRPAR